MIIKKKFLLYFFLFFVTNTFAQKMEFGIGGGISHYKGDISPNFNPLQLGFGASGLFRYNLSRSVSLRGQVLFTGYNAKDENTTDPFYNSYRLYEATGNIFEGAAIAEYNFLDRGKLLKKADWTPYLFGGIGMAKVNNKSFITGPTKSFTTPVIPYGVGVKYRFKGPWSVCAEFGTRYTKSDDFDLYYGKYLGSINTSENIDAKDDKLKFGNTTRKDQYYFTSITFTYTIFNLVCPD
jgi:Domain of unknown function (DUF6089)